MRHTRQRNETQGAAGEDCARCVDFTRDCDHCGLAEELRGDWPTVADERTLDGGIERPLPMRRPEQPATVRLTLAEVPFSLSRQPATVAGRRRARGLF